ncbi:MAG: hypothetical protein ACJ71D_06130 [Nitrososphaera sp.]
MQQQIIDLTETNTKVIQSLYPDFTSRNIDGVVVNLLLTPDFIMHVPGKGYNTGEYWGREGFKKFVSNIPAHNGGVFKLKLLRMAANERMLVVFRLELIILNPCKDLEQQWTCSL